MEKFNGLNVPSITIFWKELQDKYCRFADVNTGSNPCNGFCKKCMFFTPNLNEFKTWFKSDLKDDKE